MPKIEHCTDRDCNRRKMIPDKFLPNPCGCNCPDCTTLNAAVTDLPLADSLEPVAPSSADALGQLPE